MNIVKLFKSLHDVAKVVFGIAGTYFIILLTMWSIVYLKGLSVENAQLDLKPLITNTILSWIWIGTFIVMVISVFVWLVKEIREGITIARDINLSNEDKGKRLFWWLLKH